MTAISFLLLGCATAAADISTEDNYLPDNVLVRAPELLGKTDQEMAAIFGEPAESLEGGCQVGFTIRGSNRFERSGNQSVYQRASDSENFSIKSCSIDSKVIGVVTLYTNRLGSLTVYSEAVDIHALKKMAENAEKETTT